jgi:hypothetical protein
MAHSGLETTMTTKVASTATKIQLEAKTTPVLTAAEVTAALQARAACDAAKKAATLAENVYKEKLLVVFSKALGINDLDEQKHMDEQQINAVFNERKEKGLILYGLGAEFGIDQTYKQQRPAWKEICEERLGGAEVLKIKNETKPTYGYGIVEA